MLKGVRHLAALFALAVMCSACAEPDTSTKQSASEPVAVPPDTRIRLERTRCFGKCPIYILELSADGSVVYTGKENVTTKGRAEGRITQTDLKQLLDGFERIDYFSLTGDYVDRHSCPSYATDNPSALTAVRFNGRSNAVYHYLGCGGLAALERLTVMERAIDRAANSNQWIGE